MNGTTLSHRKITARLGEGGMGEVYRAEDTGLGREAVIMAVLGPYTELSTDDPRLVLNWTRELERRRAPEN